jgi:hypothetical protein
MNEFDSAELDVALARTAGRRIVSNVGGSRTVACNHGIAFPSVTGLNFKLLAL